MAQERKRILVVDDEPDTLEYFSSLLGDHGYEVETAAGGELAALAVRRRVPDLITLDISMPEKSGVGFYRDLRNDDHLKTIPVIVITGISEDFRTFISTRRQVPPPEGYLAKPIDPEEFVALVGKLCCRQD
jgi:CheY-like chemotaxis protein